MGEPHLTSKPRRRFLPNGSPSPSDRYGFLSEDSLATTISIDEVLSRNACLVLAPPWTGKSFVAKQLYDHLMSLNGNTDNAGFSSFVKLTNLEYPAGSNILPPWWDQWRQANSRACWIVDSIDEDARRRAGDMPRVLEQIQSLPPVERRRLTLLGFSRQNELPEDVRHVLTELYGIWGDEAGTGLSILDLAPLDAASARELVGDYELPRVLNLIDANNLQSIAAYPAVLLCLKSRKPNEQLTDLDVWREVLLALLRDRRGRDPLDPASIPPDDLFDGAARLAAALSFSGHEYIDDGAGFSTFPSVDQLARRGLKRLNMGAKAALKTGVFCRGGQGYSFAQHHTREWLTAFALSDFSVNRLRALLCDHEGRPITTHRGMMGLLYRTTKHPSVRAWIVHLHGGIAPRSDAAPWSLKEALAALDQLQQISKTARWALRLEQGLEHLSAPGLGTVVAQRLADVSLSTPEREFLIDVAGAVRAWETIAVVGSLMKAEEENSQLRLSAAVLFCQLASDDALMQEAKYVKAACDVTGASRAVANALCTTLFERKLWTILDVARYGPGYESEALDLSSMLFYRVKEQMSVADARSLLSDRVVLQRLALLAVRRDLSRLGDRGLTGVIAQAIKLIINQESPNPGDFELLHPFILASHEERRWTQERMALCGMYQKDVTARHTLFCRGLELEQPDRTDQGWKHVLLADDVQWLWDLTEREGARHPWLWPELLDRAHWVGVPRALRLQIRRRMRAINPGMVVAFDRRRRNRTAREARFRRESGKVEREKAESSYTIVHAVQEILTSQRLSVHQRMVQLAWVCFADASARPTNVSGAWEDLPGPKQAAVLDASELGLRSATPTAIPPENSYSHNTLLESFAFEGVLRQDRRSYTLDKEQIRKWLPSCLVLSGPDREYIIGRCVAVDQPLTERVVVAEMRRQLGTNLKAAVVGENLPSQFWSESLAEEAAGLLEDKNLDLAGRLSLARTIGQHVPGAVVSIFRSWLSSKISADAEQQQKWVTACDMMLRTAPDEAWPVFVSAARAGGATLLSQFQSFREELGFRPHIQFSSWPATRLIELIEILEAAFPHNQRPKRESGTAFSPTAEDELHELRMRLPVVMANRGRPEDVEALEKLGAQYPHLKEWWEYRKANRAADHLLVAILPQRGDSAVTTPVPVEQVVRLLDDGAYRLIRSDGDLQAVIVEQIAELGENAAEHLSLLYTPRKKRPQKRLEEDALQAYIFCRLKDRIPHRVLDSAQVVLLNRETLASKDQRLDIKVQAPTIQGTTATVVVEIKWSNHPQVSTALEKQLGGDYLVGGALTHGIYLVGWCGPGNWTRGAGQPPRPRDSMQAWQSALDRQAHEFCDKHPECSICALIIDLRWPCGTKTR